jgi:mono/diheme cytochrome c family protein
MIEKILFYSWMLAAVPVLAHPFAASASEGSDTRTAEQLFNAKIRPLLAKKCLACHGADPAEIKSSLDLRTREAALRGGESGAPAIVPGRPDESLLYQAVKWERLEMPPKENDRLSNEEVEFLRRWIQAGAPWVMPPAKVAESGGGRAVLDRWNSDKSPEEGVVVETSGGLSAEWTNRRYRPDDIWAFQPVPRPDIPEPAIDAERVRNPVDAFIQARLAGVHIARLAGPADNRTFIRRVTFDLHGLPPRPSDIVAFLADKKPGARERLIERLLESPHYGEQQARHWLDVVRYADTSGFSNDVERPNAWRYRDYVIRSFNTDKPYDQFITEQLAGDELDPEDPEMRIAVGFLRSGPWEHTNMTVAAVTRQQFLDDVTHHVGTSLLGQGLRCASCHDHKFDPVPTRDYYRMQAIFAPVQFAERPTPFLPAENVRNFAEAQSLVESRIAQIKQLQHSLRKKSNAAKAAYLRRHGAKTFEDLPVNARPEGGNFGREFGLSKLEQSLVKIYEKSSQYLERELDRFETRAFSVYSGSENSYSSLNPLYKVPAKKRGKVAPVHILAGGSLESPLETVSPGILTAMAGANDLREPTAWNTIPESADGRRLALARWIASPTNTFTARVIVNRIWQQHFGKGLVVTSNNFGVMGARPTHPELLDWLATWFMEHGWSIKRLHGLIMNSATYQQSCDHPDREQLDRVDSANALLGYFPPRRLTAEEIRDSLLLISDELNREMGGPGAFPEINWEVALQPRHIMGSVAPAYLPSRTPRERNRRTIYAFRYRTLSDPFLEVFNRPGCETSCERRDETTVTPQAFALFNSDFVHQRALAFADSLSDEFPQAGQQIKEAFLRTYGRSPTTAEIDVCHVHYKRMLEYHRKNMPQPNDLPTQIERGMIEEFTGEMVRWQEDLPLDDYERDKMPWSVSPEVRALAEVCLVLFNSNEFLYVR